MESKVAQFVAVTGAPSTTARNLLEACGENLDLAINMYLESGGDTVPATAAGPSGHNSVAGVADVEGGGEMLSPTSYQEKYVTVTKTMCNWYFIFSVSKYFSLYLCLNYL